MFIRALVVSLALGALWWSGSSFGLGLGLGDIRIESTLASPLKASIPMHGLAEIDLDPEQFSISVDSDTHAAIKYRFERIDDDTATLILYTREPITEPLFQFRVEIEWDRRTVARSYDVFIDPAVYAWSSDIGATVIAEAAADSPLSAQSVETSVENSGKVAVVAVEDDDAAAATAGVIDPAISRILQAAQTGTAEETRREYGPTIDGNSIWRVARAVATDNPDLNIYQWMYATWQTNPHAFFESNMHRLKMGELLVVPLEREVARVSRGEAWRAYSAQLTLLESPAGSNSGSTRPSAEVVAVDNGVQADDAVEAAVAVNSPSADSQETPEAEELAKEQVIAEAAAGEQAAAQPRQSSAVPTDPNAPNGGAPLSKVIALIDEVEREQASIVINRDNNGETAADSDYPMILDTPEEADAWSSSAVAETPARPHDDWSKAVVVGKPAAIIEASQVSRQSTMESGATISYGAAPSGWRARREIFEQLPLIGAEAPLALVGRALQKTDEFVSTSPSWAALAFGGWIAIVVMMLWREWRMRLGAGQTLPRARAVTMTRATIAPATEQAAASPVTPQPSTYKPPLRLPTESTGSSDRPEPRIDYNADEILAKADSFMQARDTDEAVKLLELAIKLQPDRARFVVRLLQIFHELKRAGDFDSLLRRFRPALLELDLGQKDELQAMHKRLCPRSEPLLGPEAELESADDFDGVESATDEAELTARQFPDDDDPGRRADDRENGATQVVFVNNSVSLDGESEVPAEPGDEVLDLEDILNEVDVYLAYGLYDNAEELLLKGMETEPNRVDYLAKLLDTYYASKNLVDFVTCAEALRGMGEEANNEYWDKVEIMGYELAPYNELFAGGKNRSLCGEDAGISKPPKADIDTGAAADFDGEGETVDVGPADSVDVGAIEGSQDLDLDFDAEASEEMALIQDAETESVRQAESGLRTDELVAELLAEEDDDPTNLNFGQDATSNVNFAQDAPIVLDQVGERDEPHSEEDNELEATLDDDCAEQLEDEAADLIASLEAEGLETDEDEPAALEADIGEDLVFATGELNLENDGFDAVDDQAELDSGTNDTMKFTITGDSEFEQRALAADTDSLEDLREEDAFRDAAEQSGQGRILLFPDSKPGQEASAEFEAEVKMTLQAIRDQLQYLTERLYRQERESCDIRQALAELHEGDDASAGTVKKKTS